MTDSTGNGRTWGAAILGLVSRFGDPAALYTWAEVEFIIRAVRLAGYRRRVADERQPDELSYAAGLRDGYRRRVAEENASYPSPAVFSAGELAALAGVQGARAAARADRTQRYAGGPVADWGPDHGERTVPDGRLFVRADGSWDEGRIAASVRTAL